MVPVLVAEMVPALVAEIVPAAVAEIVPPLANAGLQSAKVSAVASANICSCFMSAPGD